MEVDLIRGHFKKVPIESVSEAVEAKPKVACNDVEVLSLLADLGSAVVDESYIPATPTEDNPPLSDAYIFDKTDEKLILKDLALKNFVGKIKDVGKGAKRRLSKGLPQEYLYVFQYACELIRRDADISGIVKECVLIYIKINDRKVPDHVVFVVSFHKNQLKSKV